MQIRPVTAADLGALLEIDGTIESSVYLHLEQSGEGLNVGWKLEQRPVRQKLIESNPLADESQLVVKQIATGADEGLAMLVELNAAPAALLIAQSRPAENTFEIIDLRVDYEHRRQGLATALLYRTIGFARETKLRAVTAQTRTNNFPAAAMLRKTGFDLCGIDTRRRSNHDVVKEVTTLIWYATLE